MIKRYLRILGSVRITIGCFFATAMLLLMMSVAQIEQGPKGLEENFIYSIFVYWDPQKLDFLVPYYPGGYLIALTLVANLMTAIFFQFKQNGKAIGLCLIYFSVILLVIGDFISKQNRYTSSMDVVEGGKTSYSESTDEFELSIMDVSDSKIDRVFAIPEAMLRRRQTIRHPELPFFVSINEYMPNSVVDDKARSASTLQIVANKGIGKSLSTRRTKSVTQFDESNTPSALITLFNAEKAIGTWLVRDGWDEQRLNYEGNIYAINLRKKRYYHPYFFKLIEQTKPTEGSTDRSRSAKISLNEKDSTRNITITPERPFFYNGISYHLKTQNENGVELSAIKNPSKLLPYWALAIGFIGTTIYLFSRISVRWRKKTQ